MGPDTALKTPAMIAELDDQVPVGGLILTSRLPIPSSWPFLALSLDPARVRYAQALTDPNTGRALFRAESRLTLPGPADVWLWQALEDVPSGELALAGPVSRGPSLAWITLSDKGAAGLRTDSAGPAVEEILGAAMSLSGTRGFLLPDEPDRLKALVVDLALHQGVDLVITTGGTGLAPRDTTPEAVQTLLDRRLPGFEQAMMNASLAKTPHAAISRAVCGTIGRSIVVTLPGSPKAVRENLAAVAPALAHALAKLQGDPSDCAQ
ncbi:MAG: MogA/MoaB family molybdenum cofactor biosynthesis protein [Deltaproteobacteria bacterium]|nr:MogA/MoaB family molybdenum cofactor biosynthesis protein [Deltaproteobacteria bacterium]